MKSVCRKIGLILICFLGSYVVFAQDTETQELRYFKSDNAFYLGNKRLLDNEIEMTLSSNTSAFNAWKKGNNIKTANSVMKMTTGLCLGVGIGSFLALPFFIFDDYTATNCIIAGVTLLSAGIVTGIMIPVTKEKYKSYYYNAAGIYNKSKNAVSLHIGTTGNGIGFSLKF